MKKNNCFADNGNYFLSEENPEWKLAHGLVINRVDGKPMAHCWIEYPMDVFLRGLQYGHTMILDKTLGAQYEGVKEYYYILGQIKPQNVRLYDLKNYREKVLFYGHYGPWEIDDGRN